MIKIENVVKPSAAQWDAIIRGARNPMNSWDRMDSYKTVIEDPKTLNTADFAYFVGEKDQELLEKLAKGGPVHAKYRRMISVYVDITAPLYWWKEFDTYKVGTVANSCSTMHKIHAKEFTMDDFSCEKLSKPAWNVLYVTIGALNIYRNIFVNWDEIDDQTKHDYLDGLSPNGEYTKTMAWDQMIQLLPSSYNQKRTVMLNYEVLVGIYEHRKDHKLEEWRTFCNWWIEDLPYSELITGKFEVEHAD